MGRTKMTVRSARLMHSTVLEAPHPPQSSKKSKSKAAPTTEALLAKAQELVVQCEYELGRQFVDRVLERDSENVEARELKGVVEMEAGNPERAKGIFLSLVPPSPSAPSPAPPSVHLYLAQLLADDDPRAALGQYRTAVDLLVTRLGGKGKGKTEKSLEGLEEEEEEIRRMVVRVCCSMVDIWMTDLCFEPEAESSCEEILRHALDTDPENTEALLSLASVRMSQQRPDEAEQCVHKVWSTWEGIAADSPSHPAPPTLLSFARLCLELNLFALALASLSRTLEMDDQEVEAWYLEGWAFWLMYQDEGSAVNLTQSAQDGEQGEKMTKEDMLRDARDCLDTCAMLHQAQEHPDEQILLHVKELLGELEALGVHAALPEEEGEGEQLTGDGDDGEWVDEDDEDKDVDMS